MVRRTPRSSNILNLAKLERKLRRLPEAVMADIRGEMEKVADSIVRTAQSLVVVVDGDLKDSIDWTWGSPPRGALTLGKVTRSVLGKQLTLTIFAGDEVAFYARWVEFGTAPHNVAKGGGTKAFKRSGAAGRPHPGAKPNPFFFPAYRAHRKAARAAVRKAVRLAARKTAAGG